ncbi:hypothetical protein Pmani_005141 [Petrolisthes manimaculis]|uniref:Uncharacterized protein n=1 Tax=Petrolisthes manimaculis TaxID=1843537 RepID=A0AAE1UGV4_9EUCA|nr:hypothetical protein Pmani_005141 [Petrolisthes manimaculis]
MNEVEVNSITRQEVVLTVTKMKQKKAVGPDEIPVEAWKVLVLEGVGIEVLWKIIRQAIEEGKNIPDDWRLSINY